MRDAASGVPWSSEGTRGLPDVQRRQYSRDELRGTPPRRVKSLIVRTACALAPALIAPTGTISLASPTTLQTASSRRFPGPTRAKKRMADGTMKEFSGRGLRLAPVQARAEATSTHCALLRHPRLDFRVAHEKMSPRSRLHRPSISKTVNVPRTSLRGVPGPVLRGVEVRLKGSRPTARTTCSGGAVGVSRVAAQDFVTTTATGASRSRPSPSRLASLRWPGGRSSPRNPAWTNMIEHPDGESDLRRPRRNAGARASVRGVVNGASSRAGLGRWPRRSPWTCAPATRRGCAEARHAQRRPHRRRLRHALPAHGERKRMPSICSAVAQAGALAVRGDAGAAQTSSGQVLDAMFSLRSRRPAPTAPCRGRSTVPQSRDQGRLRAGLKEITLPTRDAALLHVALGE